MMSVGHVLDHVLDHMIIGLVTTVLHGGSFSKCLLTFVALLMTCQQFLIKSKD